MESYTHITAELLENLKRKGRGVLSIIVNLRANKIYAVPVNKEHAVFVSEFLKKGMDDLKENPAKASYLIPVNIGISEGKVTDVLTGWSGLEAGLGVRHSNTELNKAHEIAWVFINQSVALGTVKIGTLKVNKILFIKPKSI